MQHQRKTTAINARTVMLEMAVLMACALFTGVAVSALIAILVVWLSAIV